MTRTLLGYISLAFVACLSMPLHAQSSTFNGTAALSSQLVDRGQAITGDTPILQGAASWTFPTEGTASQSLPSGWSLGLSGSAEVRSLDRLVEAMAQASRYWSLSSDWQMQVSLLYYRYPGSTGGSKAFDRAETGINWSYRDVLTAGLSAIHVIGAKNQRLRGAADINLHWPLTRHFSLSAGAGITQSLTAPYRPYRRVYASSYSHAYANYSDSTRANHYSYGHVGLLWSNGPWRIELDRIVTAPETQQQWANLDASRWVATISWSF
ncbi:hypothetical protein GCM10008098_15790 [Rhodanobacter panaciterrae]|uniref:Outer membrane scaffolding protein for murein synthesis, MipA/OmpV family n=1 Tax=Rhodanobacter panaciterrae TaxID=490572 RepID=A0ABQ2ZRI9_9GAMM|nr:hypothetical protein [Rhodanobacter panaciterrae]GGY23213.1 hypothetical protein GCM10008098_15790 [Rhodanobacter panaciterrae]